VMCRAAQEKTVMGKSRRRETASDPLLTALAEVRVPRPALLPVVVLPLDSRDAA
jgi:hypothetical protein